MSDDDWAQVAAVKAVAMWKDKYTPAQVRPLGVEGGYGLTLVYPPRHEQGGK